MVIVAGVVSLCIESCEEEGAGDIVGIPGALTPGVVISCESLTWFGRSARGTARGFSLVL